jgi:DNA-binding MarR family transcriptional regulator
LRLRLRADAQVTIPFSFDKERITLPIYKSRGVAAVSGMGDMTGSFGPKADLLLNGKDDIIKLTPSLRSDLGGSEEKPVDISRPSETEQSSGVPDRKLIAEAWIYARRQRDRAFADAIFSDPAWDILLDLYLSHCNHRRVSVTSACIAANVPATTALRWVAVLERKGLIVRATDPRDSRRKLLSLTDDAKVRIEAALDGAAESNRRLGLGRLRLVD